MIAAIYARKSTDQSNVADDQKSVARQVEHARAYATRKGWPVADAPSNMPWQTIAAAKAKDKIKRKGC